MADSGGARKVQMDDLDDGNSVIAQKKPTDFLASMNLDSLETDCPSKLPARLGTSSEKSDDFSMITTRVDGIIRTQKFQGGAADLLNPNIIARDLGLVDKKETDVGNKDGEAFRVASEIDLNVDPKEAQRQFMIAAKAGKL